MAFHPIHLRLHRHAQRGGAEPCQPAGQHPGHGPGAEVSSADVFVSWLPLYHDMGLIGAWLGSLYYACPLVIMSPLAFMARPLRWLTAISRFGGTLSAGPNFAYELCRRRI